MKEKFDCPVCKEKKAYRSSTYINQVVCWCDGSRLELVGFYENKQFKPLSAKDIPKQSSELMVDNFYLKKLKNTQEVMEFGKIFRNALESERGAEHYLNRGDIWVALHNNEKNHERNIIFFMKKDNYSNTKNLENFYSYNNMKPSPKDSETIKSFINNNSNIFKE